VSNKILVIFLTLLAMGAVTGAWWQVRAAKRVSQVFGSLQVRESLNAAEGVTARRLHRREGRPHGSVKLDDYTQDDSIPVDLSQARVIKSLLQDPSSYDWQTGSSKSCVLNYGVLLSFQTPQRTVRVALCLDCLFLGVYDGTNDNVAPVGSAEFDPARKKFVDLAKSIFPKDAAIQAIR
jgi:hypothetical protein